MPLCKDLEKRVESVKNLGKKKKQEKKKSVEKNEGEGGVQI